MKAQRKKRKGKVMAGAVATRRVHVEFPEHLLAETEAAASALATSRSDFIRAAVKQHIESLRQRRLERDLAAAYLANAELDSEICRDFEHVDAEGF